MAESENQTLANSILKEPGLWEQFFSLSTSSIPHPLSALAFAGPLAFPSSVR
jgi:hypothetical protein